MTQDDHVGILCYDEFPESTDRPSGGWKMKHVPAHYDGTKVVPDSPEEGTQLREGTFLASLPVLTRIWTNPADAEYDQL